MTDTKDPPYSTNGVFQEKSLMRRTIEAASQAAQLPQCRFGGFSPRFSGVDGRCSLVQHANATAPDELFDVVDEEAVCSDRHVVRFEDGAEFTGFFEVEQHFSLAGCVEQDGVDL